MRRRIRSLRLLIGLIIAAIFLYLALRQLDWPAVADAMTSLSIVPLWCALLLLAAGYAARIIRWWWMLRAFAPDLPARKCAWPLLVSQALNNVLPFRAGDVVRVLAFRRALDAPAMRLAGTLVFERVLDLMTLLAFLFVAGIAVTVTILPPQFLSMLQWLTAALLVVAAVILLFPDRVRRVALHLLARSPAGTHARPAGWINEFFATLTRLKSGRLLARLIVMSCVVWLFEAGVFLAVSWSLLAPLSPVAALFATATGTLGTLLPGTPGYVGTFDYFTMLGAMSFGYAREMAAAFALVVHAVLWLPVTLAGLLYFVHPAHRDLWRAAGAARADG